MPESQNFQNEVLERLERLEHKLDAHIQRLDKRRDKWEECFWQRSKDN